MDLTIRIYLTIFAQVATMKIRVRLPNGSTEKMDVESTDSVSIVLEKLKASATDPSLRGPSLFLSLNRKDTLAESSTMFESGVRGGDLLHVLTIGNTSESPAARIEPRPSSAQTQTRPSSNLFGLPVSAPGMASGGISTNASARPRVESVQPPVARMEQPGSADTEREKRLRAIEKRLGAPAVGSCSPTSAEPPPTKQPSSSHQLPVSDPMSASKSNTAVVGLHALLAANGFHRAGTGEDGGPAPTWDGRGRFILQYHVRCEGRGGASEARIMVLKGLQVTESQSVKRRGTTIPGIIELF